MWLISSWPKVEEVSFRKPSNYLSIWPPSTHLVLQIWSDGSPFVEMLTLLLSKWWPLSFSFSWLEGKSLMHLPLLYYLRSSLIMDDSLSIKIQAWPFSCMETIVLYPCGIKQYTNYSHCVDPVLCLCVFFSAFSSPCTFFWPNSNPLFPSLLLCITVSIFNFLSIPPPNPHPSYFFVLISLLFLHFFCSYL